MAEELSAMADMERPFVGPKSLVVGSVVTAIILFAIGLELRERVAYSAWRKERVQALAHGEVIRRSGNPRLVWENTPGRVIGRTAINRWGFRDFDYPAAAKPSDTARIAFVGDSVTFGGDVDASLLFVSRIGRLLESLQCGRPVQTMNFSVGGYNAIQIEELIRTRVLPFAPDEVVYVLCMNDFDFEDASGQLFRFFAPPASFAWERITRTTTGPDIADYHLHHFRKNGERVFQSIRRMREELSDKKIGFRVVLMPVFDSGAASFETYPLKEMHHTISSRLEQEGTRVTDLLADFQKCATRAPSAFARDVWHLNGFGHQFVAEALLDVVRPTGAGQPRQSNSDLCARLRSLGPDAIPSERQALEARLSSRERLSVGNSRLRLDGFWDNEQSPNGIFAWSMGRGTLSVSGLRPRERYAFSVEVRDGGGRDTIEVAPTGAGLRKVTLEDHAAQVPGTILADDRGVASIAFQVQTWRPSDRGSTDTRELGVAVSGVSIGVVNCVQ